MVKRTKLSLSLAPILLLTWAVVPLRARTNLGQAPAAEHPTAQSTGFFKPCGAEVTLGLSSAAARQGGLLELTLSSRAPLAQLKGEWAGRALPFWTAAARQGAQTVQHALLGVDLERKPGRYELDLSGRFPPGDASFACHASIDVAAGKFAVESLKVAPGFVELSPEDRARANKESERVHAIFARLTPERLWSGPFQIPLTGSHSGHNFGKRRVLNGTSGSPHTGLDIPAPAGTPIHASQAGRVVLAENLFFSGNTVIVDHGLGVYTFYGHMKSINVTENEDVQVGAVLGLVGSTGRATGPHLHWSLIVDGARVNPLGIVRLKL
ncbi:MAG TPA: M23 family metallopeptidase [Candidatus Cybelea sp.]|nr:M23 family metallopeptidase [Candidatus Cybelea sp.]